MFIDEGSAVYVISGGWFEHLVRSYKFINKSYSSIRTYNKFSKWDLGTQTLESGPKCLKNADCGPLARKEENIAWSESGLF